MVVPERSDIVSALRRQAETLPDKELYHFLSDGEDVVETLTVQALDLNARRMAQVLVQHGLRGERVLILLPPGTAYIEALFACFYAGSIAVPVYPPTRSSDAQRITNIVADCEPLAAIVQQNTARWREATTAPLASVQLLDIDALQAAREGVEPLETVSPSPIAFLQYTSGTTGTPRGVKVTHDNLWHNCQQIMEARGWHPYVGVSWLPPYHDMGLIGGILLAAMTGNSIALLSPLHFLQRPVRWLQAITHYKATGSAAPDFAFRLCTERIKEEELEGIDLSSWEHAYCGAEPIRPQTLDRFCIRFEPYGFRREVFLPCYGLAESTLIVTGKREREPVRVIHVDGPRLDEGLVRLSEPGTAHARSLVSCGSTLGDTTVQIVDPETRAMLPTGSVGEIWVSGSAVARGYWGRPETEEPFGMVLHGDGEAGRYVRTGDLGFCYDQDLFVVGRLKNVIIIRGRNLYAEDLEKTVIEALPPSQSATCAAFPLEANGEEALGILIEIAHSRSAEKTHAGMLDCTRKRVLQHYSIVPAYIALVRRGSLPRTSSGKVKRFACPDFIQQDTFKPLAAWTAS